VAARSDRYPLVVESIPLPRSNTRVVIGLAAVSTGFVAVAVGAHFEKRGTAFDHDVLAWMTEHHQDWLTTASVMLTAVASPTATGLFAVIAAFACWWRYRRIMPALVVVGTVVVANAFAAVVKRIVAEQRPPGSREFLLGIAQSFPSGHVAGTLALAGIVAVVAGRGRAANVRMMLGVVVVVVTSAVALSRLYLGVHWVTDIGGGLLLGGAAILAGSTMVPAPAPSPRQ
jgi:membrane-associated phospholipid phosphatase